jgi:hypothetical protein
MQDDAEDSVPYCERLDLYCLDVQELYHDALVNGDLDAILWAEDELNYWAYEFWSTELPMDMATEYAYLEYLEYLSYDYLQ